MKNILFILIFIVGCSIAKKDNKAVERVEAKVSLLNKVGAAWEKIHPMIPQISQVYIHDTTTITLPPKVIVDHGRVKAIVDSLSAITGNLEDSLKDRMEDAYNLGVSYAEEYYRKLPPKHIVDTLKITIADLRKEGMLNDTISAKDVAIGTLNGKVEQLQKDNKGLVVKLFEMGGIMLVFGILMGFLFKFRIR